MFCKSFVCTVLCVLFLDNVEIYAQRGQSCRTPNNEWATCVSIYSCNQLLGVIHSKDSVQIRFLRESQCGYDTDPLVCCGASASYNRPANQPNINGRRLLNGGAKPVGGGRNTRFLVNAAIPDRPQCGQDFSEKIFGGTTTKLNEFPWIALLQYTNNNGAKRFSCAGSLINNRYILTAAHCVTGEISTKVGQLTNVRLGEYNTETKIDCDGPMCNDPLDVGIEEILYHEGYDNQNVHRYDDIALVRLNRPVTYTTFIQPICLPRLNEVAAVGARVTVAGWGKTEVSSRSAVKLKVEVPIAQKTQCSRAFASAGITLKSTQICAGGQRGRDSCSGDSGGPLMKPVDDDPSIWYQEGIVSFGARCGTEGWPGIYTKVENYLGWIHSNVKE